jgi:hypothetical protein
MNLEYYTAGMVTVNVICAIVAIWQRHVTVSEIVYKRQKRQKVK